MQDKGEESHKCLEQVDTKAKGGNRPLIEHLLYVGLHRGLEKSVREVSSPQRRDTAMETGNYSTVGLDTVLDTEA
jgi:hypothetical protein